MTAAPSATTTAAWRFGLDTSYGAGSPEAPIRADTMQIATNTSAAAVTNVHRAPADDSGLAGLAGSTVTGVGSYPDAQPGSGVIPEHWPTAESFLLRYAYAP
jgi:hypothetical protein